MSDPGEDGVLTQWWFNLSTHAVEQGPGSGNHDRLGPYATEAEAAAALERARARSDAYDGGDDD